jgi:hypothetical protein
MSAVGQVILGWAADPVSQLMSASPPKRPEGLACAKCREGPEGDIADLVPYNRGRRLRRPHFLRRRRVGHPFYVIARGTTGDDRNRMSIVRKEVEA